MSPAVAQPDELAWSGNAAPPYPTKLTSTQQQHCADSSSVSSNAGDGDSDVCGDVADDVVGAATFCYTAQSYSSYSEQLASLNAAAAPWTPAVVTATEAHAMTAPDASVNSAAVAYSLSDARSDLADDVVSDVAAPVPSPRDSPEVLQMHVYAQQQLQRIRAVPRQQQRNGRNFDIRSVHSIVHKLKSEISQQYARPTLLYNTELRALKHLKNALRQCFKRFGHCDDSYVLYQWGTLVAIHAELAHAILQQVGTVCMRYDVLYCFYVPAATLYCSDFAVACIVHLLLAVKACIPFDGKPLSTSQANTL
jgi:hypothetical protein